MKVLGIDFGANNIKLVSLEQAEEILHMKQVQVRRHATMQLKDDLNYCLEYLGDQSLYVAIYVCNSVTGYALTHRKGIDALNKLLRTTFPTLPIFHVTAEGEAVLLEETNEHPIYRFMGTNFYPSAYLASKIVNEGILVDIGTSSSDIIAIRDGKPQILAIHRPDYNRLATGELKFSGSLYTPLEYLAQEVPLRGEFVSISPGTAWTGHVYARLGLITPELMQEAFKTVWGYDDAHQKLTRLVCYDPELISEAETLEIAEFLRYQQVQLTKNSLLQVAKSAKLELAGLSVVALGLGTDLIIEPVAEDLGLSIVKVDQLLPNSMKNTLSAVGTAMVGWEHQTGESFTLEQMTQARIDTGNGVYA